MFPLSTIVRPIPETGSLWPAASTNDSVAVSACAGAAHRSTPTRQASSGKPRLTIDSHSPNRLIFVIQSDGEVAAN